MKLFIKCLSTIIMLFLTTQLCYSLDKKHLVGAWTFEEKGEKILDVSGNNHHGEMKINKGIKRVNGKYGGALEFSGVDMVVVPDANDMDLMSFTLAAWIKVPKISGKWQIIASKENRNPTGRNYGIFCNINTGVIHYSFTTAAGWKSYDAKTVVTNNEWHHIAATYEKPNFKLYLDGVLDAQQVPGTDPDVHDNFFFIGGCDIGDYWMTGTIDELVLFGSALSENEIKDLMCGINEVFSLEPLGKLTTTWGTIKDVK